MTETPNITPEQKEKNQKFILDNLDKYVIDVHGNFFNIDPEMLGEGENSEYCYIGRNSLTPEGCQEIKKQIAETILREIKDWELITDSSKFNEVLGTFRHKESGREMNVESLVGDDFDKYYKIVGELGYRENIWKNYEEVMKDKERRKKEWEEWCRNNLNKNNTNNQPPQPQNKTNKGSDQQPLQNQKNFPTQNNSEPKPENPNTPSSNPEKQEQQSTEPTDNNQESNSPTQQQPTTNNQENTNKSNNTTIKIQAETKTQITQTLKKHNLKTTDLPKKYHNWEEQLSKLTTKEQINSLVAEINQQIENKLKVERRKSQNKGNKQEQSIPSYGKVFLAGWLILVVIIVGVVAWRKKKSRK